MGDRTDSDTDADDSDADAGPASIIYQVSQALTVVVAVGVVIFLVTGAWPTLVMINGDSMQPNIADDSMLVVTAADRYGPADSFPTRSGVVTRSAATTADGEYRSFGGAGDVIVFETPSGERAVHRALVYVEEGEDWRGKVDNASLAGDTCEEVRFCPAPHSGFITKGDGNTYTDQVYGVPPVTPDNMTGVARHRVPYLGEIRGLIPLSLSAGSSSAVSASPPG